MSPFLHIYVQETLKMEGGEEEVGEWDEEGE